MTTGTPRIDADPLYLGEAPAIDPTTARCTRCHRPGLADDGLLALRETHRHDTPTGRPGYYHDELEDLTDLNTVTIQELLDNDPADTATQLLITHVAETQAVRALHAGYHR